jgi:hypothetical protein
MVDVPLGTLIFRAGLLAEEQLEDALQEGMRTGKRLGEVLLERGWLHERDLGRLLAGQKGLPFVEVSASECDPAALQTIPEEKARLQVTLPLRYEDGQLVVAVADPTNELVLENLRRTIGAEPRLVVAAYTDLIRVIGEAYRTLPGPEAEHALVAPEPVAVEPPLPESMPVAEPEPFAEPDPVAVQEPPALPTLELEPEPEVASERPLVPSLHVEPEQRSVEPAVTPLPTVLPPAEERSAVFAEVPPLQPLVMEPAAQVVEPVPAAVPVPTVEEAPAAPPAMAQLEAEPAPVAEPQLIPRLEPAEPTTPAPTPEPAASPVETVAPQLDPEPAPEPAPEPTPLPEPPAEPSLEHTALSSPAPDPVEPEPLAEPQPELEPEPAAMHAVVLRLQEGEVLDVGTFATAAEAAARAQEVVREIATAQSEKSWPFFGERYLRPDTIVSVDLIETQADRWRGSSIRSQWAKQGE